MTPQERQLVSELFDRLTTLEAAPRDADAERAIAAGLARAPHAAYALVQTALVQDEALKRADARIRELEGAPAAAATAAPGSFLDTMRASVWGPREAARGSVPTVRPGETPMGAPSGFQNQAAQPNGPYPTAPPSRGGSFLGTAASAAAGVIGGALLLDGIRSMFGHGGGPFGAVDRAAAGDTQSPWGSTAGSAADSDLAHQAGLDDIGRATGGDHSDATTRGLGLFDTADNDPGKADQSFDQDDGGEFDSSGFDTGGGDTI
jgi:hypothetical protein